MPIDYCNSCIQFAALRAADGRARRANRGARRTHRLWPICKSALRAGAILCIFCVLFCLLLLLWNLLAEPVGDVAPRDDHHTGQERLDRERRREEGGRQLRSDAADSQRDARWLMKCRLDFRCLVPKFSSTYVHKCVPFLLVSINCYLQLFLMFFLSSPKVFLIAIYSCDIFAYLFLWCQVILQKFSHFQLFHL